MTEPSSGVPFGGMTLFSSSTFLNPPRPAQSDLTERHAFHSVVPECFKGNSSSDGLPPSPALDVIATTPRGYNPDLMMDKGHDQLHSYPYSNTFTDDSAISYDNSYQETGACLNISYEEPSQYPQPCANSTNALSDMASEDQRLSQDYYQFLTGILADGNFSDHAFEDDESFTVSDIELDSEAEDDCSPKRVTMKECRDLQFQPSQTSKGSAADHTQPGLKSSYSILDHHRIMIQQQLTKLFQTLLQVNIVATANRARFHETTEITSLMMRRLLDERTRARLELPLPPETSVLPGRQTTVITRSAWHSALPGEISDRPAVVDIPTLAIWANHSSHLTSLREAFLVLGPANVDRSLVPPYSELQVPIVLKSTKFTRAEDDLLRLGLQKFGYARSVSATRNVLAPLSPDWGRICSRYVPGRTVQQARIRYKTLFRKGDFVKGVFNADQHARNEPLHLTDQEFELVQQGVNLYGNQWSRIVKEFLPHRDRKMVRREYLRKASNLHHVNVGTVNDSPVRANEASGQGNTSTTDDVAFLVRTALEFSPIANIDSDARSPLPELHAVPLQALVLPQEPSWASKFDSPASLSSPQGPSDVTFDKASDREILIAAKRFGSDVKLWPTDSLALFQKPGYTRTVIKTRLKQLTLILAQRKNLNNCI